VYSKLGLLSFLTSPIIQYFLNHQNTTFQEPDMFPSSGVGRVHLICQEKEDLLHEIGNMKQDQLNGYPPWFTDSVLKCRETVI
jgi:hypothetical protein